MASDEAAAASSKASTTTNLGGCWTGHSVPSPAEFACFLSSFPRKFAALKGQTSSLSRSGCSGDARHCDRSQVPVPNIGVADIYAMLICVPIAPVALVVYALTAILTIPTFVLMRLYIAFTPAPRRVRINTGSTFFVFSCLIFVLSLPVILVAKLYLIVLWIIVLPLSFVYSILSLNIRIFGSNMAALRPFMVCKSWSWTDLLAAIMGSLYRQGFFEFW